SAESSVLSRILYRGHLSLCVSFLLTPRPPASTLFPYTTLFRSGCHRDLLQFDRVGVEQHILLDDPAGRHDDAGHPGRHESDQGRSEEHTSELQSRENLVCRLLLEKKKKNSKRKPDGRDRSNPNT